MYSAIVTIKGESDYGHRRPISETMAAETKDPKVKNERADEKEKRIWKLGIHTNENGNVIIPAFSIMNCIKAAAQRIGMKIPGKGQKTYSKVFGSGVLVLDAIVLPYRLEDIKPWARFVPSDGKPGGGTRVEKYYMKLTEWGGTFEVNILDDMITEEVFREHMDYAGKFIGLGIWRPERGGIMGRFSVKKIAFKK